MKILAWDCYGDGVSKDFAFTMRMHLCFNYEIYIKIGLGENYLEDDSDESNGERRLLNVFCWILSTDSP